MITVKQKFIELEDLIHDIDEKHKLDEGLLRSMFEYMARIDNKTDVEFNLISRLSKRLDLLWLTKKNTWKEAVAGHEKLQAKKPSVEIQY